jgi:hypothetical protein
MLAVLCCTMLTPLALSAQSIWLEAGHKRSFGLEVLKPNFKNEDAGSFSSTNSGWVVFAALRLPVSGKILFVGELPFVHGSSKTESSFFDVNRSDSQSFLGNPYLGFEFADRTGAFTTEVGLRVPVTPDDKFLGVITGIYSEYDRFEAFVPDNLPVMAIANYRYRDPSGFVLKLRGGPSLLIYTGDSDFNDDVELFLGYSAQTGYESERFSILGGITGRALLTTEDASFDERSIHQLGFNASVGLGQVRPGVHFRLPLDDDLKAIIDSVLGLNLGVQF